MREGFKKRTGAFLSLCLASLVLAELCGCASLNGENCPYVINNPRIELGEKEEVCKYMGAYFDFYNNTEKLVTDFSVSFLVFDEDGKNPFLGTNNVVSSYSVAVPPKDRVEVSIDLDGYLATVPENPYQIDYLYVKKISYSDGTTWQDAFGMYARSVNDED